MYAILNITPIMTHRNACLFTTFILSAPSLILLNINKTFIELEVEIYGVYTRFPRREYSMYFVL